MGKLLKNNSEKVVILNLGCSSVLLMVQPHRHNLEGAASDLVTSAGGITCAGGYTCEARKGGFCV